MTIALCWDCRHSGIPLEWRNYSKDGALQAVLGSASLTAAHGGAFGWLDEISPMRIFPSCPLKAKAAYEASTRLSGGAGSALYYTSHRSMTVFYLLPVWYAHCVYTRRRIWSSSFTDPIREDLQDNPQYAELVFEAQKNKLMDWDRAGGAGGMFPKLSRDDVVEVRKMRRLIVLCRGDACRAAAHQPCQAGL